MKATKTEWAGRALSALSILPFIPSTLMKLTQNPQAVEGMARYGFPDGALLKLGVVELLCILLYVIPRTATLGAILLTGYLGGAICTHFRASESVIMPIALGVFVWGGLYLRDPRFRQLLPLRR